VEFVGVGGYMEIGSGTRGRSEAIVGLVFKPVQTCRLKFDLEDLVKARRIACAGLRYLAWSVQ